jgi:hypothetical protein
MTTPNTQVRIQNRTSGIVSAVSLDGFFRPPTGGTNVFDPKVMYAPCGVRWVITAPTNSCSAASSLLIAVSATNDPTGTWTGFALDVDAANTNWFDYPSMGFNRNWVVVTRNMFTNQRQRIPRLAGLYLRQGGFTPARPHRLYRTDRYPKAPACRRR